MADVCRFVAGITVFRSDAKIFLIEKTRLLKDDLNTSDNETIQESNDGRRRRQVKDPTIRECVKLISQSSRDFIEFLSPQTLIIKDNLKIPLLLITFSTGLMSAMT